MAKVSNIKAIVVHRLASFKGLSIRVLPHKQEHSSHNGRQCHAKAYPQAFPTLASTWHRLRRRLWSQLRCLFNYCPGLRLPWSCFRFAHFHYRSGSLVAFQKRQQLLCTLHTLFRINHHASLSNLAPSLRHLAKFVHVATNNLVVNLQIRLGTIGGTTSRAKELLARKQLIHNGSIRPKVGVETQGLALQLLWRTVTRSAATKAVAEHTTITSIGGLAQAEVGDQGNHLAAMLRHQNVAGFQVAVHHLMPVKESYALQ